VLRYPTRVNQDSYSLHNYPFDGSGERSVTLSSLWSQGLREGHASVWLPGALAKNIPRLYNHGSGNVFPSK
jgi:hypothetical protein